MPKAKKACGIDGCKSTAKNMAAHKKRYHGVKKTSTTPKAAQSALSGLGGELGRLQVMAKAGKEGAARALYDDYLKGRPNLIGPRFELTTKRGQIIGRIVDRESQF